MAGKNKLTTEASTAARDAQSAPAGPFRPDSVRVWLDIQIGNAERVLRDGPTGSGWAYNESKRPEAEAHLADLRGVREVLFSH
jgi:hypothetical protein